MHYYAVITSDYCKQAEMALASFFNYNDVILNLYVVDSDYDKVCNNFKAKWYRNKLNIVNFYSADFNKLITNLPHAKIEKDFPSKTRLSTLNRYRILDYIEDDKLISVDLDVMYFGKLDFTKYKCALNGIHEPSLHLPKPYHDIDFLINIGICKYIKSEFKLANSFTDEMIKKLKEDGEHYWIPDQDIFNELAKSKCAIADTIFTRATPYTPYVKIKAIHYTTPLFKPWTTHPELQTCYQPERILALGFLLYQHYARRSNLFLEEATANVNGLLKNSKDSVNFTLAADKNEFKRLCSEIDSWKI